MIAMLLFALISVGFGILAEVYMHKTIKLSHEQFVDYQLVCSDVRADSIEDLAERIKNISEYNISTVSCTADTVSFTANKNEYTLHLQDGVVYVEYDFSPVSGKPSPTKVFKVVKLSKDAQKATVINSILDSLSGKSSDKNKKIKKKLRKFSKNIWLTVIACIVAFVIAAIIGLSKSNDDAIENVKSTNYSNTLTYGEIVNTLCPNGQEWDTFITDNDTACVEVNGISNDNSNVKIQFLGDYGVGFSNSKTMNFRIHYLSIGDQSYDPDEALKILFGD